MNDNNEHQVDESDRVDNVQYTSDESLSISEFKFWIEGIREMQPPDWTPSREQWDLVLRKISCLEDATVEQVSQLQQQAHYPNQSMVHPSQMYHSPYVPPQGHLQHNPAPRAPMRAPTSVTRGVDENGNEILVSNAPPIDGRPVELPDGTSRSTFG